MARALNALHRHLALAGFMGAGKTTIGAVIAQRLGRTFIDLDAEIERRTGSTIGQLFDQRGEAGFRPVEEDIVSAVLSAPDPAVIALGGGSVLSTRTRDELRRRAFTVLVDVDPEIAWERVRSAGRPLGADEESFYKLYRERRMVYDEVADGRADDADGAVLAAAGVHVEHGSLEQLEELVPGQGPVELVADAHVAGIHGVTAQLALGVRDGPLHEVPSGEAAKAPSTLERLWSAIRLGRDGTLVALGGGCTTDLVGFAAATYMRGIAWVAVPTTLVGQVDAAIGGKTAIDLSGGKNLVGSFHWPARVIIDPATLETLPAAEHLHGLAEVVKTGLLMGETVWDLAAPAQVRACAAFKASVCLRDPHEHGARAQLNLGHTFAHALESAAGYDLPHGRAVALGLLAALRLSGQDDAADTVREVLRPEPVRVDRDAAWAALLRDKKGARGTPRLVLLEAPGSPRWGVQRPDDEVRGALDDLIAD